MKTEDYNQPGPHRKAHRLMGLLLVVLTLCGTLLVFMQRPRPLLDRASVVLEFEGPVNWLHLALNDGVPVIATLSDTNWLVGQLDTSTNMVTRYRMDRLEFNPQRRSANARLTSILNQRGLVGDIEPSPDGKWVIGTQLTDVSPWSPAQRVVCSVDGSRVTRWPANFPEYPGTPASSGINRSYIAWMPDSQNVAEIVANRTPSGTLRLQGTLHDVHTGHTSTLQFSAPSLPEQGAQLAIRPDVLLLSSVSNLDQAWTSPVRRLVRFDMGRKTIQPMTVDLYAWPLRQSCAAPQISHLKTPAGTWLVGLAFSPNGKRIAWEVVRDTHPLLPEILLYRLLGRPTLKPSAQIEVWTSDREGSGMEKIGDLPSGEYWDYDGMGTQLHVSWLPKQIGIVTSSFLLTGLKPTVVESSGCVV